jgi:signal transduction histidine kinase/ActR/RegA family two-component response regulator
MSSVIPPNPDGHSGVLSALARWHAPPVFADEEKTRLGYLLHVILWSLRWISTFMIVLCVLLMPQHAIRWVAYYAFYQLLATGGLWMVRRGSVRPAAWLLVSLIWLVFTFMAWRTGGVVSTAYANYSVLVILAGLLINGRAAAGLAVVSLATGLGLALADREGYLPVPTDRTAMTHWMTSVFHLSFIVVLQVLASRAIRKALEQARGELDERHVVEDALRSSEDRYRAFISQSGEGIWRIEVNEPIPVAWPVEEQVRALLERSYIAECNDAMARMYGYKGAADMINRPLRELLVPSNPNNVAMIYAFVEGGYRIDNAETCEKDAQGNDCYFLNNVVGVVTDGKLVRGWGTQRAITELKKAEDARRQLEAELRKSQKMQAVGTLAGGIAHDFNNVLMGILGNAELAQFELTPENPVSENVADILSAARRGRDLVQQIMAFSRRGEMVRTSVRLAPILEEAVKLMRPGVPSPIDIRTRLLADSPTILGNPTQIHQVIMNLGTNAAHAIGRQAGAIDVTEEIVELSEPQAAELTTLRAGRYVCLTVADTGCGMDAETIQRIFDPFFTTKSPGEGTGLGLAVVYGIVEAHGGAISVKSQPGKGAQFRVYFPLADPPAAAAAPAPKTDAPLKRGQGERLLVVDDDPVVLRFAQRALTRLGYEPILFSDPRDALAAFQGAPEHFAGAITDMAMPGMKGTELAAKLLAIRGDLPIVMASGFGGDLDDDTIRELGIRLRISKPFEVETLASVLRAAIGAEPPRPNPPTG